jgi:hypothetical protein
VLEGAHVPEFKQRLPNTRVGGIVKTVDFRWFIDFPLVGLISFVEQFVRRFKTFLSTM